MKRSLQRNNRWWLMALLPLFIGFLGFPAWASDDVVTEGTITALSSDSVTVDSIVFALNGSTEYEDANSNPIPFSSFSVGADVKARGNFINSVLVASRLELLSAASSSSSSSSSSSGGSSSSASSGSSSSQSSEVEVEGIVQERSDTSLKVQNITFSVNNSTNVVNEENQAISYELVTVGSFVEVEGSGGAASKIKLKIEDSSSSSDGDELSETVDDVETVGRIEAVTSTSLTVDSIGYVIDAATRIEGHSDTPLTVAALAVGQLVKIEYVGSGNIRTARKVEIEGAENEDSLEATGPIGALTSSQITVRGLTATVSQSTAIKNAEGVVILFSALRLGEIVKLHAREVSPGNLTATEIRLRGHAALGDLNDDNKIDKVVYRDDIGMWFINYLDDNNNDGLADTEARQWGLPGDIPVLLDSDGDGRNEIAVYRPSNGTWYLLLSTTGYRVARTVQWGLPEDRPIPGDFDCDSISDIGIWRPSTGQWFILLSSGGSRQEALNGNSEHLLVRQWGLPQHQPIVMDRDGDCRDDLAVIDPVTGVWYTLFSSSAYNRDAALSGNLGAGDAIQFGLPEDKFLAGDFDGDGRTDISAWRQGVWFIRFSSFVSDANPNPGAFAAQWGLPGDQPGVLESGPENEDRRDGLTVYRTAEGSHYDRAASGTITTTQWGLSTDVFVHGHSASD